MARQRNQAWAARGDVRRERIHQQRTLGRAGLLAALAPLMLPSLLVISARSVEQHGYMSLAVSVHYAERIAGRFSGEGLPYHGIAIGKGGGR